MHQFLEVFNGKWINRYAETYFHDSLQLGFLGVALKNIYLLNKSISSS